MAFNRETFKTRSLTAVFFVMIMLTGLLWNQYSFFILFSFIHFGVWYEYQQLVKKFYPLYGKITGFHSIAIMLSGWCLMLFFTSGQFHLYGFSLQQISLCTGLILLLLIPIADGIFGNLLIPAIGYSLTGLIYISLSLALLVDLRFGWTGTQNKYALVIPLLTIFSLWINDTMAYISGSLIGKTPLSSISPKKTWEGTIAGICLTIVIAGIGAGLTNYLSVVNAAIIAAIAAISGTLGDLFESKLKRMAGVKDSGNIMPGHGGFLDRFDSLLFAGTCVWLYVTFFINR